jgi:alpha-D-xyloside xylohydrolase
MAAATRYNGALRRRSAVNDGRGGRLIVSVPVRPISDRGATLRGPLFCWTNLLTGEVQEGPGWRREQHGFLSLPLMVRPNTILPLGAIEDRPDYDYADNITFRVYELADGSDLTCQVFAPQLAAPVQLNVRRADKRVTVDFSGEAPTRWRLQLSGTQIANSQDDVRPSADPLGVILKPVEGCRHFELEL